MSTSNLAISFRPSSWLRAIALLGVIVSTTPAAAAPSKAADEPEAAPAASTERSGVVNVNTATEADLVRLPGVGPAKAQAILALREQLKGFKKLEDLMRVKGIGRKTFRDLQPMLSLEGPTTLVEKRATKSRG